MRSALAVGLAVVSSLVAAPSAQASSGIVISLSVDHEIGPEVAHITKGTCTVKGSGAHRHLIARGRSTDDGYLLVIRVAQFTGYGKRYDIHPGLQEPASFQLWAPKGLVYSNLAHDPGEIAPELQTGAVGFRHKGAVLRFSALAPEDDDVSKGVQLVGSMKCS